MKLLTILSLLIFLLLGSAFAQSGIEDAQITIHPVAGNIYMLEGYGGNIGVSAGDDGILIIDDQMAPMADKIKAALKEINPGELKFLLNTHVHGDHVGGNEIFGKISTVIAHEKLRSRMIANLQDDEATPDIQKEGWPVITFESSLSVHFNGEEIKMQHFPAGHTDGDAVIYFSSSNVVHMGDLLFNRLFPFIDVSKGGSVDGYIANVEKILNDLSDDVKIIPGHGPLASKADLSNFLDMIKTTRGIVMQMKSDGKSLDEVIQAGLGEAWKNWSWSFITEEKWIATLYGN